MLKTLGSFVVRAILITLGVSALFLFLALPANAQTVPPRAPVVTTTPPAGGAPPAGAPAGSVAGTTTPPAFTITAMTPGSVASAASEYPKLVTLRGANLDKLEVAKLKLSDGTTDLDLALADQPTARSASLTVKIPASTKGEFVLSIDGADTKLKLVVKDQDQIAAEKDAAIKAAADRKLKHDVAVGVAASVKVNDLQSQVNRLSDLVDNLGKQTMANTNALGDVVKAGAAIERRLTTFEEMLNANTEADGQLTKDVAGLAGAVVEIGSKPVKLEGKKPVVAAYRQQVAGAVAKAAGTKARIEAALAKTNADLTNAPKQ